MKIMVIKSLKYLVKTAVLIVLMLSYANAEVRESRALVVASQEAILSSELAARIENIAVKEMQRFKKGDLLIQFDCSLYEAQKDVVSANANSALIKLKSDEQMLQMRSIGKYELELSISEYEKAKSELLSAELNVENLTFFEMDILDQYPKEKFDLVISNPPYVPKKEIPGLMKDVKDFEPEIALTDFDDGLTFYKRISKIIPHILKDDSSCILELGLGNHPEKVLSIFKESGYSNMEIFDDYNGDKRVLSIKT